MPEGSDRIMVVDDDRDIVQVLTDRLEADGFAVDAAFDGREAMQLMRKEPPALALLDLQMPEMSGMEVLQAIREEKLPVTAIVLTAYGTIEKAVEAMKAGAYDFLTKPFDPDHIRIVVNKALERENLRKENRFLQGQLREKYKDMFDSNETMKVVLEQAKRAAQANATVLILGESGTGKEVLAKSIHRWSPRADKPFVAVNCVALSEELLESELFGHEKGSFTGAFQQKKGKLEIAEKGTIFLDEIGDIEPSLQAKLLRFLQEHEFERVGGTRVLKADLRVVAATNTNLVEAMKDGKFREDLYYRLNVVTVTLPPLRERKEDLLNLANLFLHKYTEETKKGLARISKEAERLLLQYNWPGNIRELENVVERAIVLGEGEEIRPEDLPAHLLAPLGEPGDGAESDEQDRTFHASVERFKRSLLTSALAECSASRTKAAELLGLQRTYLSRLLSQFNIS